MYELFFILLTFPNGVIEREFDFFTFSNPAGCMASAPIAFKQLRQEGAFSDHAAYMLLEVGCREISDSKVVDTR